MNRLGRSPATTLPRLVCGTALGLLALAATPPAHGAILANYPFSGGSAASTDTDPDSAAGAFSVNGSGAISAATGMPYIFANSTPATQAAALAGANFFQFSVAAGAGRRLALDALVFDLVGGGGGTSPQNNTITVHIQSDSGGLGTGGPVVGSVAGTWLIGYGNPQTLVDEATLDLAAIGFPLVTSVTFQFRFSDTTDDADNSDRIDNVRLLGTAVPEPAAAVVLLALAAGALPRRRRGPARGRPGRPGTTP